MDSPNAKPVAVGDLAPDFTRKAYDGTTFKLSEVAASKAVVMFFYPRDFSPICTAQACAFRDSYEDFKQAGAEVVGISADEEASHEKFSKEHRLPFKLVSDADGSLRALFGVPKAIFLFPGRTTYVIDRTRTVRDVFTAQLQSDGHVKQALAIVKGLKS